MQDDKKKNGRFQKGKSGNPKGRPRKRAAEDNMSMGYAKAILEAGAKKVVVVEDGRRKTLSAIDVIVQRQVQDAVNKQDRQTAKLYLGLYQEALKAVSARRREAFEKLGAYLKMVSEGRAPRLEEPEAAFLQKAANDAGYNIEIRAYKREGGPEPISGAELDALATPQLRRALGQSFETMGDTGFRLIIAKILQADRRLRFERDAVQPRWK